MAILQAGNGRLNRQGLRWHGIGIGLFAIVLSAASPEVVAQQSEFTESSVKSADGTEIAYAVTGSGPPLVLVHGSLATGDEWRAVAQRLGSDFTVYVMTRRGRGRSGPVGDEYSIQKEAEDIQAVIQAAGPGAHVVAHSYGAIGALEVAREADLGKLVVYEPPLPLGPAPDNAPFEAAVKSGDLDSALEIGLRTFLGLGDAGVGVARKAPTWKRLTSLTPSWLPEREVIDALPRTTERFAEIDEPILIVLGSMSPPHFKPTADALSAVVPNVSRTVLEKQGHIAFATAPDLLADEIRKFLKE